MENLKKFVVDVEQHVALKYEDAYQQSEPISLGAMAEKVMRAVQYDSYAGAAASLKHVEVPIPKLSKGEVLLKLEATSLNPVDWKVQKGQLRPIIPHRFPFIPATDVAGEVVEIGSAVKDFKVGDKVVALLNHLNGGGLAEYASAKQCLSVLRPFQVSAAEGATLPVAGITAYQAVQSAGIKLDGTGPLRNILVTAASGGVGHFAVQLAKLGNAHVTATCGARNVEFVKSLGADEVIDYKTPEGASLKSPSGKKYDAVIHCATGIPWSTFEQNLNGGGGKVIDITPSPNSMCTFVVKKLTFSKKYLVPLIMIPRRGTLDHLVKLVAEGKVKVKIDSTHELSKAEDAWTKIMEGHATGKIVVQP